MTRDIHEHRILILDFGSQYTQLIARRVREAGVYCELHPYDMEEADIRAFDPNGVILSGGPESVAAAASPRAPAGMQRPVNPSEFRECRRRQHRHLVTQRFADRCRPQRGAEHRRRTCRGTARSPRWIPR